MRKIYDVWLTYAFMDWRNKGSNIEITGLVNYLLLIQIQYLINSPVILKSNVIEKYEIHKFYSIIFYENTFFGEKNKFT
jgi:hypothetical protein